MSCFGGDCDVATLLEIEHDKDWTTRLLILELSEEVLAGFANSCFLLLFLGTRERLKEKGETEDLYRVITGRVTASRAIWSHLSHLANLDPS